TSILTGGLVTRSFGDCWLADYDNDGYLDVLSADSDHAAIFHNNGSGSFTKQTSEQVGSIVSDLSNNWTDASWGDYDNDGFIDLFVTSNSDAPNFLYHNNGNGSF